MANNNPNSAYNMPQKPKKLLLGKLFTDAQVKVEPEEPQKMLVAGLAEARIQKEYPDTFFKRAAAVFRGEFSLLFKASLFMLIFALPFIVMYVWFHGYFESMTLSGIYNFMGDIGVGFPGGGDSIAVSVGNLYRNVNMPVMAMYGACLLFGSLGLAGVFYCAKRSYYQNYYKNFTRTFWMGFAKYWWQFLLTGLFMVVVGLGMVEALMYLLEQQALGTAGAGAYCAVVFSWIFGAPLLLIPMIMMGLLTSYQLNIWQCFKNAIVIIVNNLVVVPFVAIVSAIPLVILVWNNWLGTIVCVAMALIGATFMALCWIALASRGMVKCRNRLEDSQKAQKIAERKAGKQNPYTNGTVVSNNQKKKKQQQNAKPYQNPKKKKKK